MKEETGGERRGGEERKKKTGGKREREPKMEIPSLQIPFREALHIFKVSIVFVS